MAAEGRVRELQDRLDACQAEQATLLQSISLVVQQAVQQVRG